MEFETPIRHEANKYTIPISTTKYMDVLYRTNVVGSLTTPPLEQIECKSYIADMAVLYETYSKNWFDREVLSIVFVSNVRHEWKHPVNMIVTAPKYENIPFIIHQVWRPHHISLEHGVYTIHWVLISGEQNEIDLETSPSDKSSVEIPYGPNQVLFVLRKMSKREHERKLRKARINLEAAKYKLYKLLTHYIEKYGTEPEDQSESDTDSLFGPGEK